MRTLLSAASVLVILLSPALAQSQVGSEYPIVAHSSGLLARGDDDIYYETSGEGDAIVLCHGLGGNHAVWFQQVAAFARDYRVITWDQRGFGRSTSSAENALGPATAVDDLAALLDHLQVGRAHVVGQSMGGWTALGFLLKHPKRVKSLVMADTIGGIYTSEIRKDFLAYVAEARANAPADGSFPLGRHPAVSSDLVNRAPAKALLYQQIGSFPSPPRTVVGPFLITTQYDLETLHKIEVPTLFVVGSDDRIFPPAMIRQAAAQIPGSAVCEIAESGHSPYFERPAQWNEAVLKFLKR